MNLPAYPFSIEFRSFMVDKSPKTQHHTMYSAGTATRDITAFKKHIGMMGYGMHWNTVEAVETPLLARAFVFEHHESGKKLAFVVADIAFITLSVRAGVLKRLARKHPELGFQEENVLLTAQHTHSGPGGYSHYGLYNISIPGFVPAVWKAIVDGITQAIVAAHGDLQPARLHYHAGAFPEEVDVARNRSMRAYLANPDAKPIRPDQDHLALDRTMRMLRIDKADGTPLGAINWFGLHCTSVHNDNHRICWDNKGYAAEYMEQAVRNSSGNADFTAAFAQGAAGDVTPNFHWDRKKKWTRGPFEDDFESARHFGKLQFEQAMKVYEAAPQGKEITGPLAFAIKNVDFSNVACDPDFTNGRPGQETGSACHGVAFFCGTKEGPGMKEPLKTLSKGISFGVKAVEFATIPFRSQNNAKRIRLKYKVQGPKFIMFESGNRKVFGTRNIKRLFIPAFADKGVANLKRLHPRGWQENKPWVPHILPLQIVNIGEISLVALPAETSTIAAQRIQKVVAGSLLEQHEVVIAPYANAYCGYITTYEEYQKQCYEGGHTVFGEWTLAAFQTKLRGLAEGLATKGAGPLVAHEAFPPTFSAEELEPRTYAEPT